ncbi:MAG: SdiA-regulated domain-containing protein [Planctomycetes bacterium]|nr:SdiA-regulated domain-containing protein [Planctomycetota bacterium]
MNIISTRTLRMILCTVAIIGIAGCQGRRFSLESLRPRAGTTDWSAEPVSVIGSLDGPVCVEVASTGVAYVSNGEIYADGYWADDGSGFISHITSVGDLDIPRWKNSNPRTVLNSPKGMCLLKGNLYVADNTRIVRYPLHIDGEADVIEVSGAQKLTDVVSDGKSLFVSDLQAAKVVRIDGDQITELHAPTSITAMAFHNGALFAVTSDSADIYEIPLTGQSPGEPFGLTEHFSKLSGIDVLEDGTFVVADSRANRVFTVGRDRKTVKMLVELRTPPAMIGVDRWRNRLFVPELEADQISVFSLGGRQ